MAAKSKTKGTPEYRRRQQRLAGRGEQAGSKPATGKPGSSKVKGTPQYKRRQARLEAAPYKDALKITLDALAPQLTAQKQETASYEQHAADGGGVDRAYDAYQASLGTQDNPAPGTAQGQVQSTQRSLTPQADPTGPDPIAQEAQAQAAKFGQTSAAVDVTNKGLEAMSRQTSQQASDSNQVQNTLSQVLSTQLAGYGAQQEQRRIEAKGAATTQANISKQKTGALEASARSGARESVAAGQQQDFANRLAAKSLGVDIAKVQNDRTKIRVDAKDKRADNARDERKRVDARRKADADRAEKRRSSERAATLEAEGMSRQDARAQADRESRERIARQKARVEREKAKSGGGGDSHLFVGRNNEKRIVTHGERKAAVEFRKKLVSFGPNARGTGLTPQEYAKAQGGGQDAEIGWYIGKKKPIPRAYIGYLERKFPQGIPADIHKQIAR